MESVTYADFGLLSRSSSLRDCVLALQAHRSKLYHLGVGKTVTRSNLSKANEQRDFRIFEDFAYYMIAEARRKRVNDMGGTEAHIYAFDSTTIALCPYIFDWVKCRKKKGGIKVHTLFDAIVGVPTFVHITEAKVHETAVRHHMVKQTICNCKNCNGNDQRTRRKNVPLLSHVSDLLLRVQTALDRDPGSIRSILPRKANPRFNRNQILFQIFIIPPFPTKSI